MTKTSSLTPPSPTGRLSISEPDRQYFPGTPEALAQRSRMKAALAQGNHIFMDFSGDFDKAETAALEAVLNKA